ncbi:Pex12 amino terminal region-domain-containing protein [Naematelia encephala]|uniref:RING-type E3 ubiquitin transferase n=1 Tax=Naematelia encephala TaxID=71784 RepID=A0A1Y2ATJ8_9TREE|nr:Pex12 amino terminal region-domain-containing protein [Naematelia encephala]
MDPSAAGPSRQVHIPPPAPASESTSDAYARLSFAPASQAQILRAHQRDTSQVQRLIELTSELLRSLAGTRWLAHKQTVIDLLVRAVYLFLTFGRGARTLGEEYTDILPYATWKRRIPSRRRRFMTILLLLLPSLLTSPSSVAYLRSSSNTYDDDRPSQLQTVKKRLASFIESPWGQALPELHVIAFMFRGRFFEFGKRLTGISYVSTLPPRPPEQLPPSYEPLGLMLLLPLVYRFFPRRTSSIETPAPIPSTIQPGSTHLLSPPLTPPATPFQTIIFSKAATYDTPNTYLTPDALALPERQCTLCLEPRGTGEGSGGTVAVTECGHIFCWGCLGGLDKLECPLCRQTLRMERLVAAYNL